MSRETITCGKCNAVWRVKGTSQTLRCRCGYTTRCDGSIEGRELRAPWREVSPIIEPTIDRDERRESLVCPYRSAVPVKIDHACQCGSSSIEQPIYRCDLHQVEVVEHKFRDRRRRLCPYRDCLTCRAEGEDAITAATAPDAVLRALDVRPPINWPDGWETWENVHEAHRRLFARESARIVASPKPSLGIEPSEPRGVVTLGGGPKYFVLAYVMVSVLRRVGCSLPVRWYVLPGEINATMTAAAEQLGNVEIVNLRTVVGHAPRMLGGWEAKIWSILYSPFREVLFLDADIVPAHDPTYLFDDPRFHEHGAVLWPDLRNGPGLDITADAFRVLDLVVPGNEFAPKHHNPTDYRPIESGQILLDRSRVWRALEHVAMLCDHSDYLFRMPHGKHRWHIYGDKSTFYLGFQRAGQAYAMPRPTTFYGGDSSGGFMQYDFNGQIVFQHKCQPHRDKLKLHGENKSPGPLFRNWKFVLDALDDLRGRWDGRV